MSMNNGYVTDRSAWEPQDLESESAWKYILQDEDIDEINLALNDAIKNNLDITELGREDFELPGLSNVLQRVQHLLENDRGVFVFKGLPVDQYTRHELQLIYMGLGVHFGFPLPQSMQGELLQEVYNKGEDLYADSGRGTNTAGRLPWHTDRCDIVSLLCISKSCTGGESKLASLPNVYNKIKEKRPDLADALRNSFYHGRAPFEKDTLHPWYRLPIFTWHKGKFASRYLRRFIEIGQDIEDVPRFTKLQLEALDYLDKRLDMEDVCLKLPFDEGDIQFVNNFTICHSRNEYTDSPEQSRLLMRLWLAAYNGCDLAPEFAALYGETKGGMVRGGILF